MEILQEVGEVESISKHKGKNGDYWKLKVNGKTFNTKDLPKVEIGDSVDLKYNVSEFESDTLGTVQMKWIQSTVLVDKGGVVELDVEDVDRPIKCKAIPVNNYSNSREDIIVKQCILKCASQIFQGREIQASELVAFAKDIKEEFDKW